MALLFSATGLAITLVWTYTRNPRINFLPADHRAEWILFPLAVDVHIHPVVSVDTTFRRDFTLEKAPHAATLNVRAAKRINLKINGSAVNLGASRTWKKVAAIDVLPLLRPGPNIIEARVFNDDAPPALWFVLTTDQVTLLSDQTWQASFTGSAWRNATPASVPRFPQSGNLSAGGEGTFPAVATIWPIWLGWGAIALAIWWVAKRWLNKLKIKFAQLPHRSALALLIVIATLWMILFWNNAGRMSPDTGFDGQAHLDYIKYVQERRALPLPNEGFEMFQPPLYYILSATALSLFGTSVHGPSGILVLRFLTTLFGIAHFTLVFLSLRLLFPNRIGAQLLGLLLATFLPMQLYLSHYVTNETLAATLTTLALYLGLRLLQMEKPSRFGYLWLGVALGAAMLTKTTAVLLVPALFLALAGKLAAQRSSFGTWLRTVGVMIAACVIVCGWHYLRIWRHFGTPFLGNWEAAAGSPWWQDPGYRMAADYARFGRSLNLPLFSGLASFADGIYSTLWGDGLCGGWDLVYRPPWNYGLMAGGYLLWLGPTLLIAVGAIVALYRYIRKPSAELFLLLCFGATVAMAVIVMTLKVASYAQVKALYGLAALVPLCGFAVISWDAFARRSKIFQATMGALVVVCALNSFASFWIVPSASQHIYAGQHLRLEQKIDASAAEAFAAVKGDPSSAAAHAFLAAVLNDLGRADEALQAAERAKELTPFDTFAHLQIAAALSRQGNFDGAIDQARRAVALGPDNAFAFNLLLSCLIHQGRMQEAIDVARDALVVGPFSPELHYALAVVAEGQRDFVTASTHFGYAILLRPDWAEAYSRFHAALLTVANAPDAAKQLQKVAALAPDSTKVNNDLASFGANRPGPDDPNK